MSIKLRHLTHDHAAAFCRLVVALADFEKLTPPDEAAQMRLVEDALGVKPRIEVWLAFAGDAGPVRLHDPGGDVFELSGAADALH
jgi:hypothetical protein